MKAFNSPRKQRGFTLAELMVVGVILAILIIIVVRSMNGNTDATRASMLLKTASSITSNFGQVAGTCGVSKAVASNPVPAAGKNALDVVFEGESAVAAAQVTCYRDSSVRALREVANKNGTGWRVENYAVQLTGGGANTKYSVVYTGVPNEVALAMAQKYNSGLTALAASDNTSDVLRYGADTGGLRSVTVLME